MVEPSEETTMKPSESVKLYDNKGKKIGNVLCPQNLKDILLPGNIEFHGFYYVVERKHRVWKDPNSIIFWAWTQAVFAAKDLTEGKIPTSCIICSQKSIIPIYYVFSLVIQYLIKDTQPNGIMCENLNCPMYKVVIPWKIFSVKAQDFPPEILIKLEPFLKK